MLYFLINPACGAGIPIVTGYKRLCLGGARFYGKIPEQSEDDFYRKPL